MTSTHSDAARSQSRDSKRFIAKNSSRYHLERLNEAFAKAADPGMRVLDAGAGTQPYRHLFVHLHYESADFGKVEKAYAPSDYICDLADIPVEDGRFDRIIFNQVLEHVPDPVKVLTELRRVLKPGGKILCSCPLFYEEHEKPYDYYRYTQFSLRLLFEKAGYRVDEIAWVEGYFGTVAYQFRRMAKFLPLFPPKGVPILAYPLWPFVMMTKLAAKPLFVLFNWIDRDYKYSRRGYPINYAVIATAI